MPRKKITTDPATEPELPVPELDAVESDAPVESAPAAINPDTLVEVWERRFFNPGPQPSKPIRLKAEGMVPRWINTSIEGRYHRAIYEQGWQPVPVALLADPASIPDLYKHVDGFVHRGERGKEVLMMMPITVFQRIQRRKAELTIKSLKNIRNEVAGAAATTLGPEAGDFAARGESADGNIKTIGTIKFGTERLSPED
jgi:hypothetical protein